jgi:Protein kinase domain
MNEHDPQAFRDTEAASSRSLGGLLELGLDTDMPEAEALAAALPQYDGFTKIGMGGMGVVWRARQIQLDRTVAIKLLRPELAADPSFAERFAREARALARLQHPNIVAVYDYGQALGLFYLVMEHIDGTDLRALLDGELTAVQALAIVPQLCDALQYAHEEGVIHRDVKPENILVDRRGRVRIADFGLAKLHDTHASRATSSGRVLGTAHYMAPEQIDRPGEVDHRADIFALGVVIYEMLTGKLPIGRFQPPSHLCALDVRLDEVVLRTLEHDRELRFQQVSEVKDRVVALGPTSTAARPVASEVERRVAAERRKTNVRGALSVAACFAFAGASGLWIARDAGSWSFGFTPGLRFGVGTMHGVFLAGVACTVAWIVYDWLRERGTPRGAVHAAKLGFLVVLANFGVGVVKMAEGGLAALTASPFQNGVVAIVVSLAVGHVVWTRMVESKVPLRIVLGPSWWIPRWEAELEPRDRTRKSS